MYANVAVEFMKLDEVVSFSNLQIIFKDEIDLFW